MVCRAIINTGLAFCLVLQASVPCCYALQFWPALREGECHDHRCYECPTSAPDRYPNSECAVCSVLGQFYGLPWCGHDFPKNEVLAARLFAPDPAIEARNLATLVACRCDAILLCDIYEMQTLRE